MRVLSVLSLLCMSMLGVSGQFVINADTSPDHWAITGQMNGAALTQNPTLNLTAGNSYTFDVSAAAGAPHPFAFSSAKNEGSTTITDIGTTFYTVTKSAQCTSSGAGVQGNGCIITLAITANAPATTIWYKCTIHPLMTAPINIVANTTANPTTATPTTATPTTPAPSGNGTNPTTPAPGTPAPTTGGTITSNALHITNNQGTTAWVFTDKGVQYTNPTIQVTAGQPVTISFEYANSQFHPFSFSPKSNTDNVTATQDYFPDALNGWTVTTASTCDTTYGASVSSTIRTVKVNTTTWSATSPCVITIQTQASDAGTTLYYRCAKHPAMVGKINIIKGNSASTVAGAGMALVVALIVALFA